MVGGGFDMLYNTFKIFNMFFLTFNLTFNNFTAVLGFSNCYVIKIIELPNWQC